MDFLFIQDSANSRKCRLLWFALLFIKINILSSIDTGVVVEGYSHSSWMGWKGQQEMQLFVGNFYAPQAPLVSLLCWLWMRQNIVFQKYSHFYYDHHCHYHHYYYSLNHPSEQTFMYWQCLNISTLVTISKQESAGSPSLCSFIGRGSSITDKCSEITFVFHSQATQMYFSRSMWFHDESKAKWHLYIIP